MTDRREGGHKQPNQGTEPPVDKQRREDTEEVEWPEEEGRVDPSGPAEKAVSPDQPAYPPPPPEGTETTEPVEEEDLPGSARPPG